jgi:hypothetical protein
MGATDAVKDNVYATAREAVNFFHEVELSIINWDKLANALPSRLPEFGKNRPFLALPRRR